MPREQPVGDTGPDKRQLARLFSETSSDHQRQPLFIHHGQYLVEWAGLAPGDHNLDVAAGTGATLVPAARQVGQFVAIPKAQFGDSAATLEVIPATAGAEERGISIQGFKAGDRVTVVAHGNLQDGTVGLAIHTTWELGEPALGLPWPSIAPRESDPDGLPGALMTLPDADAGVALAKADGTCLTKDNGEQETGGFGGNVEQYYVRDAGSTELDVAASPGASCQLEPDIGTVTINAAAGQRVALLPWGQGKGQIQLLVVDMGAP